MADKGKYRPVNQLQKDCLRQFRKWFPHLVDKIEFVEPFMDPDSFCFSIQSDSPEFGNLTFEIDDQMITVRTKFDHHHYETSSYDYKTDENIDRYKTIWAALLSVKNLINGNELIELEKKGDLIRKAFRFHKDDPENPYSVVGYFKSEIDKRNFDPNIPVERILLNWNGIISRETITTDKGKYHKKKLAKPGNKAGVKLSFWTKLKEWWHSLSYFV